MNDAELLQAYANERSESAFRAIVERYLRLVYGACWRQLGDRHLAEDATQGVFVLLSQRAGKLQQRRVAGWLLTVSRYVCANIRKTQIRRERREQVVAMRQQHDAENTNPQILAMLDEGLGQLSDADREALVLRYLQEQPLRDVGQSLGVSEEAARKRVDRGLGRLRKWFGRRGIQTSAVALAAVLSEQESASGLTASTQAAITENIVRACHVSAPGGSMVVGLGLAKGIKTMMLLAKLKIAAMVLAAVLASGGASWLVMTQVRAKTDTPKAVAPATQPATPTTQALAVDLSTPEKVLDSLIKALKELDRDRTYQCLGVDPKRKPMPTDGSIAVNFAQIRLVNAAVNAFGPVGEEARDFVTLDMAVELLKDLMGILGNSIVIEDNSAVLVINLPEVAMQLLPGDINARAKQWQNGMLRFRKINDKWVFDYDRSVRTTIVLFGPGRDPLAIKDPASQAQFLIQMADARQQTADEIESGAFKSWEQAKRKLYDRIQAIFDKHGQGIKGCSINAWPISDAEAEKM
ncbi:MAG: sigma-70 family RNA polymerase sigma factor [Planctomycetota bacterium]|nr:sigma-70 family RNA polymerase sigma factor [Planctomycetota bacterium]